MVAITFDTHQFVKDLQAKGFNPEQAEGISDALKNVMVASELATSDDIREIRSDIEKLELRVKAELSALKWMVSVAVAGIISIVLKTFF
jgi:polyhydroxyalkanoate synthesis regulator phasin